ncbi:alpha/beta hydrolase family protein [Myroides odoratimimus]|uniref:alpha/beta hydrolase family protein n=1 Tax=Myroides odoratimimus TaxID=76832 RepID=UPI0038D43F7C
MRWKILAAIFTTFLIIFLYFFFLGSQDFDDTTITQKEVIFTSQGEELSATLFLPKKEFFKTAPIAIFIHGDGPQNKTSNSGYLPLIHHLVDQGIAVFTWDKKGIDKSKGNWLNQSITDRAVEAKDAFDFLVHDKGIAPNRIGYLGFSQGGWVIPKAAILTKPAFSVIIGGAINWMDQGYYYTTKRLEEEGYSEQEIKRKADSIQQADYKLFTDFNDCTIKESEIEKDRFLFIARNLKADSSVDLQNMQGPLLALWGSDDLNVPAGTNAQLYQQYTSNRESDTTTIKVYPRSTHGLLNAKLFNYQLDAQWPEWKKWLFVFQGRKAYSKDALFDISTFILKTNKKTE